MSDYPDTFFRINSYIVGCKLIYLLFITAATTRINSYIVGCKCAKAAATSESNAGINSYIVGCKWRWRGIVQGSWFELIVT